ncbi:MAG: hypothetical protein GF341_05830, partial [candidate division Zixibacteria bacterium]|nr:hypothetical protein [candidate division Zixibacteria bacterium]
MGRGNGTLIRHMLVALVLLLGNIPGAYGQCEPILEAVASLKSPEQVHIVWHYPPCDSSFAADTVSQHEGKLDGKFRVDGSGNEAVIAISLPELPSGTVIRQIRTYVLAVNSTSVTEWQSYANLWCSIHW